jgi:hypothetical protein
LRICAPARLSRRSGAAPEGLASDGQRNRNDLTSLRWPSHRWFGKLIEEIFDAT